MLQFLNNLWQLFILSNYIREIDHFMLDFLKRFDTYHPKEDHNERDFKHLIIGGILGLLENSSKIRGAPYKWFTTLSVLDLLKIFSEVIVASKRRPLASIEKQAMS